MQQIQELISYFQGMTLEKFIDIIIAIAIVAIFSLLSSAISYFIIKMVIKSYDKRIKIKDKVEGKENEKDKEKNKKDMKERVKHNAFFLPLKAFFIVIGISLAIYILQLPDDIMQIWYKIFKIILICILAKGLINIVDPKSDIAKKWQKKENGKQEKTIANFAGKILKYVIYIFAGFLIITELDYDVSSLVVGLGLGSTVLALAAQDFVKGLIAGMSIISDKPFLVGDYIEVGSDAGTVVDISFRVTKIKTSNDSVVTLPNATITESSVINWSKLKRRRYDLNLKLPLETSSDTIDTIVNRIRFVLEANENIIENTVQVNFTAIEETGNNINIYMYTSIVDYGEFLKFKQRVNQDILKVLESEGVKMAYPGQNVYLMKEEENKDTETVKKI